MASVSNIGGWSQLGEDVRLCIHLKIALQEYHCPQCMRFSPVELSGKGDSTLRPKVVIISVHMGTHTHPHPQASLHSPGGSQL
jgi:hypothetical protein